MRKIYLSKSRRNEKIFITFALFFILILLSLMGLLLYQLLISGLPYLSLKFLSAFPSRISSKAGIFPALIGTLYLILMTSFISIPLGISSGLYLQFYAQKNRWTKMVEISIVNLASVPSIIYGLLGLGVFVYQWKLGQSILTGSLTLALLILPIIIVTTRESIKTIPKEIIEAAFALGSEKWQVCLYHIIPYSMGGILTGTILAISRALGETAPIIAIGAVTFISFSPSSPINTSYPYLNFDFLYESFTALPIQMFQWLSRPQEEFHALASATGLLLILVTIFLNIFAFTIRNKFRKKIKWQ